MRSRIPIALSILMLLSLNGHSQHKNSGLDKVMQSPDKFLSLVNRKAAKMSRLMQKSSEKYLTKLQHEEKRLEVEIKKKDSASARSIFGESGAAYIKLKEQVSTGNLSVVREYYSGHKDSMATLLNFMRQDNFMQWNIPDGQLNETLTLLKEYQQQLNATEQLRKWLKRRELYLKEKIAQFGLAKEFRKYQKAAYYYRAQIEEYRKIFDDPGVLESKLLTIAQQIPSFQKFFNKYSQLAGIFRLPGNEGSTGSNPIPGLQTRDITSRQLQDRLGTGPRADQYFAQQVNQAQSYLDNLKNKAMKGVGNGDAVDIPNFKPNSQRTKSFLQRLQWGTDIQSTRANSFFPVTTDIGLSLGFRASDKSIIGLGASYKMGWGQDIRHLQISHQGLGLRSFLDVKLKGSFWISGGAELNYRSAFKSFDVLNDFSAWQQSALLGLAKRYALGKKIKGNLKIMYDFLYRQQVPVTQPVVFRVGYEF